MKKRSTIVLAVTLAFVLALGTTAAVFLSQYARMTVFSGHIEQSASTPDAPALVLKSHGIDVGQSANIATDDVEFPVLYDVSSEFDSGVTTWQAKDGKTPISAAAFALSAKNGEVQNVCYKIEISGDVSAASALRFGVTTSYFSDELATTAYSSGIAYINSVDVEHCYAESDLLPLGDSTIAEGEDVEICLYAWVDGYALADIGEYFGGDFTVNIVFTTGE